tara:strand:+ start:558 stop:1640 length:1083 start_codon:yes stop_codon:yes gene_type:complete
LKNLKGKIINHNNSFNAEIKFNEKIVDIKKNENIDFDNYIIPGFVDLHCHGGNGFDTMGGLKSIENLSFYHLKNGTTTLLPTTITASLEDTVRALKGLNNFINENKNKTNILGVHLEGPFISPFKLGAQPNETQPPNFNFIKNIEKEAKIKVITIAPELDGADKLIKDLIKNNINVQIGHSVCSYESCIRIMKDNKIGFTHLYNAMSGTHHRKPGVLTAALLNGEYAEIICDLFHVKAENIHLAKKNIPKLYAITDAISATGMKDGEYNFGNNKIIKKNNQAFINDDILAGSVVNMHETFKNLIKINFSLNEAVAMTSYNATKYIQEKNIGKIEEGYYSNFVVIDKNLNIKAVYLQGNIV